MNSLLTHFKDEFVLQKFQLIPKIVLEKTNKFTRKIFVLNKKTKSRKIK